MSSLKLFVLFEPETQGDRRNLDLSTLALHKLTRNFRQRREPFELARALRHMLMLREM